MLGQRASRWIRWYLDNDHVVPIDLYIKFRNNMVQAIIDNPEGVTLPLNLGMIKINQINSRTQKAKVLPRRVSRHTGERTTTTMMNYDTAGDPFRAIWYSVVIGAAEEIKKPAFHNSDIYSFKTGLTLRRAMFDKIKAGEWHDYHMTSFKEAPRVQAKRGRPRKIREEQPIETK